MDDKRDGNGQLPDTAVLPGLYAWGILALILGAATAVAAMVFVPYFTKVASRSGVPSGPSTEVVSSESNLPDMPDASAKPPAFRDALARADSQARDPNAASQSIGTLAGLYAANGFMQEAVRCYEEAERRDASEPRWPYYAAVFTLQQARTNGAADRLRQVLALAPDQAAAALRLAGLELKAGRVESARQTYEALRDDKALGPYTHLGLAQIAIAEEKWETAVFHLKTVLAADAQLAEAGRLLSEVFKVQQGGTSEALKAEATALMPERRAPDIWVEDLSDYSFDPVNLLELALTALDAGRPERAKALADRAAGLDAPKDGRYYLALGDLRSRTGDVPAAEEAYRKSVEIDPQQGDGRLAWAEALRSLGKYEDAAAQFRQAADQKPDDAHLRVNVGFTLKLAGRHAEALEEFRKAQALMPDDYYVNINLVTTLVALNKAEEIAPYFAKACAERPGSPDPYISLGNAFLTVGKKDEARVNFEKALAIDPNQETAQQFLQQLQAPASSAN